MTAAASTTSRRRAMGLVPTVDERVDNGLVLGLVLLGLYGFHATYGGSTFLLVGLLGALLGVAVSHLADRLGQPLVAEVAVTILIFFLLGGALAAPGSALGGLVPTSSTISSLATAGTHGWKELLTLPAPVGNTSNLLTIPYLVGLVGGVGGATVARRTKVPALPLVAPVAVLAVSILFGGVHPTSLFVQGALFAVAAIAWVMVRSQRRRVVVAGPDRRRVQAVAATGLLALAALIASAVGPNLPFSGHQRVVLSRYVVPPFDVNDLSSPLAGFRRYTPNAPQSLATRTLFTVSGLKVGDRVRIATMDSYNDLVWGFGAGGGSSSLGGDVFRRYGTTIPAAQQGRSATVDVQMGDLAQVWLPDVGQVTSVRFSGSNASNLTRAFRYDAATGTAAMPTVLGPGERYELHVVIPPTPAAGELRSAAAGSDPTSANVPAALQALASQWAGSVTGAWARVTKLASTLKTTGKYSNGTETPPLSQPGHNAGRLAGFVQGGPLIGTQIVGDDEQYAAALALMSDAVGVPARVVLGAAIGPRGVVTGADVHAWVEVSLAGLGWVPVDYSSFLPTTAPTQVLPQPQPINQDQTPVAPPVVSVLQPPPDDVLPLSPAPSAHSLRIAHHTPFHLPAWVVTTAEDLGVAVAALLVAGGSIVGVKAVRRRRRRRGGSPLSQIAGGWHELLDQARDAGHAVPPWRTRPEQAGFVPAPESGALAAAADGAIFGPDDPLPEEVRSYWEQVRRASRSLRTGRGWKARLKAELNLASLRPRRHRVVPS